MNMLDLMNKLTKLSEAVKDTGKGKIHTADPGGYGRNEDEPEAGETKKKAAPRDGAPRGRGRPKKGADDSGSTQSYDFTAFGAPAKGKDIKLKPWDKSKTTKHTPMKDSEKAEKKKEKSSLKDWIENLDSALNEGIPMPAMQTGKLSATPLPGATAIKNAQGQQVATASTPQAAAMMTKGDVTLTDPTKKLGEEASGKTAKIFYNRDVDEYTVKFYQNGKHMADADYYTDDKEDARQTAKAQTQQDVAEGQLDEISDRLANKVQSRRAADAATTNKNAGDMHSKAYYHPEVTQRQDATPQGAATAREYPRTNPGRMITRSVAKTDAEVNPAQAQSASNYRKMSDVAQTKLANNAQLMKNRNAQGGNRPAMQTTPSGSFNEAKKAKPDFLDVDKDGNKKEPFKKAVKDAKKPVEEAKKAKPDFLDVDKDGNKKEPFKKAVKDAQKDVAEGVDKGMRPGHDAKMKARIAAFNKSPSTAPSGPFAKYVKRTDAEKYGDEEEDTGMRPDHDEKMKARIAAFNKGGNKVKEGKDEGKPGKNFAKIAKSAGEKYGSKAAGERVAGAVRNKLKAKGDLEESKMSELDLDLKDPKCSDAEFKKQYGKSKADMRASMKDKPDAKKPVSKVKESIIRESRETLQHIINKYKNEAKRFVAGDDLDEDLFDALYDYYCDQGEMPYGTMKARDGDPYEWVTQRFDQDVQDYEVPMDEGKYSQDYFTANKPSPIRQAASMPTKPAQTPWSSDPIAAFTDRVYDKFSKPKSESFDVQFEGWSKELDNLLVEGMNVTANTGLGDGPDSVTISATDDDAQKLLAIVKSAGLGMFGGDEQSEPSQAMSVNPSEPGSGEQGEADIEVVDDHDGMLSLIRKMTGQGSAPVQSSGPEEVDEEHCQSCAEGSCQQHGDAVVDEEVSPHDYDSDWDYQDAMKSSSHDDSEEEEEEDDEEEEVAEEDDGAEEEATDDVEEEQVEESFANDADKTFESDIDFMQNVISGGLNGKKRTQSVGNPVTIAATPMRESTDLLKDWKTLSGLK